VTATPVAAKGGFHNHHGHHGHNGHNGHNGRYGFYGVYGVYGVSYAYVDDCLRSTWVDTPWGPRRRLINVCF
jgi:hypothetical protein